MKKGILSITIMSLIAGVFLGINFKTTYVEGLNLSFADRELANQISTLKQENKKLLKEIQKSKDFIKSEEDENIKDKEALEELRSKVKSLRVPLGYEEIQGAGIIISIDSPDGEKLSGIMEEKKFFISLLNNIRLYGGEAISINGERIGPYTEIAKAGNHININSTPVAPPYEIKVVGDPRRLTRNINDENIIIGMMVGVYDMKVSIKLSSEISIPPLGSEKNLIYIK